MKTKLKYLPNAYTRTSTADNAVVYTATGTAPKKTWEFDLTNESARVYYIDNNGDEITDPTVAPVSRTLKLPSYEQLFLANQEIIPFAFNKEFTFSQGVANSFNISQPVADLIDIYGDDTSVNITSALPTGFVDNGGDIGSITAEDTVPVGTYTIEYDLTDTITGVTSSAIVTVIIE